jgi:hypothetical protein
MPDMKTLVDFVMNLCCAVCVAGILICVVCIVLEIIYIVKLIKTGEK